MRAILALVTVVCGVATGVARGADYVWWEGETPAKSTFPAKTWMSGASLGEKQRAVLSGGDWLTADGKRGAEEAMATYRVEAPAEGTYNLWVRKFWQHGPFKWRFGDGAWTTCGRDVALADSVEIRTHLVANWVFLGKVTLSKGVHEFEIRLLAGAGENQTAAFDCFLLTPGAFLPNGKLKPGEKSGLAEEGHFAWEPGLDPFRKDALLDLRHLNEDVAGEKGPVGRRLGEFVLGSKEPVRFWAVNVSTGNAGGSRESVDYLADKLAKIGVNMVRFHGPIYDHSQGPGGISARKLDDLQYMVAAMKKRGIYTTLSFYFPLWVDAARDLKLPGYAAGKHPFALLMFDRKMQETHRAWMRGILAAKNPHGPALAEEPALALVELQNEDSFFFWTFGENNLSPAMWEQLEKQFGAWAAEKHGSLDKAFEAWGGKHKHDDAAAGRAGLYGAWNMTSEGVAKTPGGAKRVGAQVEFLATTQRKFYKDAATWVRHELKFSGLIVASNWHTADPRMLDALERWTYTAGTVIDRHGYFGGKHEGPGSAYSVATGHLFEDASALQAPEKTPFQVQTVEGFPHIISELGFTQPNRFRADAAILSACYGRLQNVGGLYFFSVGSNFLRDAGMNKFQVASPAMAGTFPAAALMYRRGDVAAGPVVVREALSMRNLLAMKGSAVMAAQALDALREPSGVSVSQGKTEFDPLSFYAGRVTRAYDSPPAETPRHDLSKLIDRKARVVRSATGELTWDYGNGVLRVNTPRAQAAAGFLGKAGRVELGDVTVACGNEYASIAVVSLDGLPLKTSKRVLVQAMTEEKPYGFKAEGGKITEMGGGPMGVRNIDATVSWHGHAGWTATALDENGYAKGAAVAIGGSNTTTQLKLPVDAAYVVLQR